MGNIKFPSKISTYVSEIWGKYRVKQINEWIMTLLLYWNYYTKELKDKAINEYKLRFNMQEKEIVSVIYDL